MTLDPRTQLAQTMLMGLTNQNEFLGRKKPVTSKDRDPRRLEQERRSLEALTQALLDPFSTVQEAKLNSLVQRAKVNTQAMIVKDRTSG